MEMDTVLLEDQFEYVVVDTLEINNTKYLFLGLKEELENQHLSLPTITIRKLDQTEENILGLDSEEEYKMALQAFVEKGKQENS